MRQGFHFLTPVMLHPSYCLTRSTLHILSMSLQFLTLLLTLLGHLYAVSWLLSTDVIGWNRSCGREMTNAVDAPLSPTPGRFLLWQLY